MRGDWKFETTLREIVRPIDRQTAYLSRLPVQDQKAKLLTSNLGRA